MKCVIDVFDYTGDNKVRISHKIFEDIKEFNQEMHKTIDSFMMLRANFTVNYEFTANSVGCYIVLFSYFDIEDE